MSNENGKRPQPTLGITRNDDLEIMPLCPPLQVDYKQEAPAPRLTVQLVFGMIGEVPSVAIAVLEQGKLKPEQYQIGLLNLIELVVAGRPQMKPTEDAQPKSRIILPPGAGR